MIVSKIIPGKYELMNIKELTNESLFSHIPLKPFNNLTIDFFSALSKSILRNKISSANPDLVSLAFWLRNSNIENTKNNYLKSIPDNQLSVPRGIAFHIAPSNVDTIFMYSLSFSMLAGNCNIVRISQKINPTMELLLELINKTISITEFEEIARRNLIINYPHDDEINKYISSIADIRIIWGGNSTVNKIRSYQAKPTTKDISFADKVSYTIINSLKYIETEEKETKAIAHNFFNDAYYFNQMGCSSPRIIYFVGGLTDSKIASIKFWNAFDNELDRINYTDEPAVSMKKLIEVYRQAAKGVFFNISQYQNSQNATVLQIERNEVRQCRETCGGGFFYQCFLENINDLKELVKHNDQTLTYFGYTKEELMNFANELNGKGIDRIVPIGQALAFSPVWDGYVLLNEVTKRIYIA